MHTQARDVGVLGEGMVDKKCRYEIESIRGFDFFPQTGHVEGVAVLRRQVSANDGDVDMSGGEEEIGGVKI